MAVSGLKSYIMAIPASETAVRMYKIMQMRVELPTAMEMSFSGRFASGDNVVIKSNPR